MTYGTGNPDRPGQGSVWSRPADRRQGESAERAPAPLVRPHSKPAALPAGPSATAAEVVSVSVETPGETTSPIAAIDPQASSAPSDEHAPSLPVALGDTSDGGPGTDGEADIKPDDDTAPLPVILPERTKAAETPANRMRDPFEPLERAAPAASEVSGLPTVSSAPSATADQDGQAVQAEPAHAAVPQEPSPAAGPGAAKMEQIKDLYLTAEAIGEDALAMHFKQVSDRQRQLIKEYFDQVATQSSENRTQSQSQAQG
jgi:hypothetical protein